MKKNNILLLFILPCLITINNCASDQSCCIATPPKIHITGEQTLTERQLVGEYKELEKNAWAISSVRSTVQRSRSSSTLLTSDDTLNRALKVREFHENKIRRYKDDGACGETRRGLLKYRTVSKYSKDTNARTVLKEVIKNENEARHTIFNRVLFLKLKRQPTDKEIIAFSNLFAQEQFARAKKNDWLQESSGKWRQK